MARSVEGFIAVNRFGLGARPGELEEASANPRQWLRAQLSLAMPLPPQLAGLPPSSEIVVALREMKAAAMPGRPGASGKNRNAGSARARRKRVSVRAWPCRHEAAWSTDSSARSPVPLGRATSWRCGDALVKLWWPDR